MWVPEFAVSCQTQVGAPHEQARLLMLPLLYDPTFFLYVQEDESVMRFSKTPPIMADPEVCTRVDNALRSGSAVFPGLVKLSEWKGYVCM